MTTQHPHEFSGSRKIGIAFFLNLSFTLLELGGGFLTNSMAILADALHDFGDSFALGLSYYLEKISTRESDRRYSYGYRRYSLLAALLSSIILLTGSVFIIKAALQRLLNPVRPVAEGMALLALVGIMVNGIAFLQLRRGKSLNLRVVGWHLIEDVLGWIAVLVISIVLLFSDLYILDPILSIGITLYIIYHVIINLKKTTSVWLQAVPEEIDTELLVQKILAIPGVLSVHHTHVWTLDGENHVLSTHVVVAPDATKAELMRIKGEIKHIAYAMDCEHVTLELEYSDEDCSLNHTHCDHD